MSVCLVTLQHMVITVWPALVSLSEDPFLSRMLILACRLQGTACKLLHQYCFVQLQALVLQKAARQLTMPKLPYRLGATVERRWTYELGVAYLVALLSI